MANAGVLCARSRSIVVAAGLASLLIAAAAPARAQAVRIDGTGLVPALVSMHPAISFDGRYVAFVSPAPDLVPGDIDGTSDFFRYDRVTGTLERSDITLPLTPGEYPYLVAISTDGRWLLFNDLRGDWVAGDTNHAFDAFLYDFTTGAVRRVSVGAGGAGANGGSAASGMSLDARYVVFDSWATNLVTAVPDTNAGNDVFVRDMLTETTVHVSRGAGGLPANGVSNAGRLSPDGEWVAFISDATNLVPEGDTNGKFDVYLSHWRTGAITRVTAPGLEPDAETFTASVSWDGAYVAVESMATNVAPGAASPGFDTLVWDRLGGGMRLLPPSSSSQGWADITPARLTLYGGAAVRVRMEPNGVRSLIHENLTSGQSTVLAAGVVGESCVSLDGRWVVYWRDGFYLQAIAGPGDGLLPSGDADGDGLDNGWEVQFGFDAQSGAGDDGPDGDPDHDGATNTEERAAGTHPRGRHTRHLAEGAQNTFFATRVALLNARDTPAHALVRFMRDAGPPIAQAIEIPAHARRTILAGAVEGVSGQSFAVAVDADVPLVVDRTMLWDRRAYGGHTETAVVAPLSTWFLAEGSTAGQFDLFYLLENPNPVRADVDITWALPPPLAPVIHTYALPPSSRTTIYVDQADVRLASTDAAAIVQATAPIFVERAMYWSRPGLPFAAGHAGRAVPAATTTWYFAEGATGGFFETFLLLLNPYPQATECEVRYLTTGGSVLVKPYVLPPWSRTTIWVDREEIPGLGRALANATFSTVVEATDGHPIVVERAMWWPDGDWQEAHLTAGAIAALSHWAFADGDNVQARTYVLIANTSSEAAEVRVTLLPEDGGSVQRSYTVAARSRFTLDVEADFPSVHGRRFGALVDAMGATPAALVVERATYWNAEGVFWGGGTGALATPLP